MARIRTIKPEFQNSESVGRLSRDARLTFVLLWPHCDDEGRCRAASRMLASLLFPYDDDAPGLIGGWLAELEQQGCIRLYEVDGDSYLEVPKFLEYQKIDHPKSSKLPAYREASRKVANVREESPRTKDQGSRIKEGTKDQGAAVAADIDEARDEYNSIAEPLGWPLCQKLSSSRRAKLAARLADCGGVEGWRVAMAKARASPYLRGETKRQRGYEDWKPDFDFFVQESSFTKLMEGKYDSRSGTEDPHALEREVLAGVGIEPGVEGVRRPAA